MKYLKNKSGFTLVELIVIFALAAIVLTPLTYIMSSSLRNEVTIQRIIDSDQSMQQTFIVLNEIIRTRGYDEIILIDNLDTPVLGDFKLKVDNYTFFLDGKQFKYQKFNDLGNLDHEHIMNEDIYSVKYTLKDVVGSDPPETDALEIEFKVDRDNDTVEDETFIYRYSKRE